MATTVYNITGSGGVNASAQIYWNGEYQDATQGGRPGRGFIGRQSEVVFKVTGTDATLEGYLPSGANLQPVAISVDGGAFTLVPAMTLATWTTITLFAGLSDTAHTVIVRDQGASVGLAFYVDRNSVVTVTGGAPAISVPTGYGNQYKVRAAGVDSFLVPEGGLANTTNQGNNCKTTTWTDTSYHFKATIATLSIWCHKGGQRFALWIDGVKQTTQTIPTGSTWGRVELYTGLDDTAEHDYVLQYGNGGAIVHDLMTTGGTGINTTTLAVRPHIAGYGDSRTASLSSVEANSTVGWLFRLGMLLGCAVYNRGIGSTALRNYGAGGSGCTTNTGETRETDITNLAPEPTHVFEFYGVIDALGTCASGVPPTTADYKTSRRSMIDTLLAGVTSSCHIYTIPIQTGSGNPTADSTTIPAFNVAAGEVVSEVGAANLHLLSPSMIFTTLHPGAVEQAQFADELYALLNPTNDYVETGLALSLLFSQTPVDTAQVVETSKAQTVLFSQAKSDVVSSVEGVSQSVLFTQNRTDFHASVESGRSQTILFSLAGTDVLVGSSNYDETGRSQIIEFSLAGTDTVPTTYGTFVVGTTVRSYRPYSGITVRGGR